MRWLASFAKPVEAKMKINEFSINASILKHRNRSGRLLPAEHQTSNWLSIETKKNICLKCKYSLRARGRRGSLPNPSQSPLISVFSRTSALAAARTGWHLKRVLNYRVIWRERVKGRISFFTDWGKYFSTFSKRFDIWRMSWKCKCSALVNRMGWRDSVCTYHLFDGSKWFVYFILHFCFSTLFDNTLGCLTEIVTSIKCRTEPIVYQSLIFVTLYLFQEMSQF